MPIVRPRKAPKPPRNKRDTRYVVLKVSIREAVYLDALVTFGLHGENRDQVVQTFLRRGLQEAMKAGFFDR